MMFMFPLLLQCAGVIPESLLTAINMLIYDESLSDSHPDLQMTLLGYLQQMKQDRYDVYVSSIIAVCWGDTRKSSDSHQYVDI